MNQTLKTPSKHIARTTTTHRCIYSHVVLALGASCADPKMEPITLIAVKQTVKLRFDDLVTLAGDIF